MNVPKARKLKSGTWFIQLRLGGESIPVTGKTERACVKQAEYVKSQYLVGKREKPAEPEPELPEPEKLPTLGEAMDAYIAKRDNVLSPSTVAGYKAIKRTRFLGYTETSLSDMDTEAWQIACNQEAGKCSAKTLRNAWGFIASVIQDATSYPAPKVKLPQVVIRDMPFLEPEDIETFIEAVKGTSVEIAALLGLSSLRRSEILALRWDAVDLKKDVVHVRGAAVLDENHKLVQKATNKNATSARPVPIMIPELHSALATVKEKTGLVVQCHANSLWENINDICEENNLPLVGVHGLRRSFVSLAYHLGLDEDYTMAIGGWSDIQTMRKHYKRLAQSDIRLQSGKLLNFYQKTAAPESITPEEAVEILLQEKEKIDRWRGGDAAKLTAAFDMAISALSPKSEKKPEAV